MTGGRLRLTVLLLAGVTLAAIGAGAAFAPDAFYSSYGIVLGGDTDLTSELRAAGLALLALGAIVIAGAFVTRLSTVATLIGAVVLLAYAGGRLLSWAVDGAPSMALALAGAVELALGAGCLWVLMRPVAHGSSASLKRTADHDLTEA